MNIPSQSDPQPGAILARGVSRMLLRLNFFSVTEFVPARGLRADVCALGPKGEIWIVECKSGVADFRADHKWRGYLEWCDQYFWAVDQTFPIDILPENEGLIFADGYDGDIIRPAQTRKLAPARRKALTLKFARNSAERLRRLIDPDARMGPM